CYINVMLTYSQETIVDREKILEAIDYSKRRRANLNENERLYLGDHDVLYRVKDPSLKNNKLVINHAKDIVDIKTGYLIGNPVEYQVQEELDIDAVLEEYREQAIDNLNVELGQDCSV